jgi:hypothetical protein
MLACLKCMLDDGFTVWLYLHVIRDIAYLVYDKREMPVFGIIHDEVLVGIVVRIT